MPQLSSSTTAQTNDDNSPRHLRVAIVGGGIAGLALATFLSTASSANAALDIDIYESAPSLTELGAGVGLWIRAWKFLADAVPGLADDLKAVAPQGRDFSDALQKAFEFRKGDRSEGLSFYTMEVPFGVLTLHRADFQRALARYAIPPARPHFGKKFTGYEYADENDPSSEIILKFADGSTARADLLVGADGIRSPVRHEMARRLLARGIFSLSSDSDSDGANNNTNADTTTKGPSSTTSLNQTPDSNNLNVDVDNNKDALSDLVEPVWSGTIVYRSLIPFEVLEARFPGHRAGRGPVMYFGKNKHIVAYPISASASASAFASINLNTNATTSPPALEFESGKTTTTTTTTRMVNLVAFVSEPTREGMRLPQGEFWVRPALREEILDEFDGWEEEVRVLLDLAEKPLAWAVHIVNPLPMYSDPDGRVVLLGDAAHAMTPHQGAGAGQAIEDAYVLASLLLDPRISCSTLPGALRAYDAVRIPISQRVVSSSRQNGLMVEFNHSWEEGENESEGEGEGEEGELRELTRLRKLALAIMEIHKWEWEDQAAMQEDGKSQADRVRRLFKEFF